jgi:hypothetical protein
MGKVKKTEHENLEFGHTKGEIFRKTCKIGTLTSKGGNSENNQFLWYTEFLQMLLNEEIRGERRD